MWREEEGNGAEKKVGDRQGQDLVGFAGHGERIGFYPEHHENSLVNFNRCVA